MSEVELKFQLPTERRAAVQRAVATASARVVSLRAIYFDTPDHRLATARLSLRLRREGRRWLQTLKAESDAGPHERLEHEVPVAAGVTPDPARHAGSAAGERLRQAVGDAAALQAVHASSVRRTERELRVGASRVALALDVGQIEAAGQKQAVHELEFELRRGRPADLFAVAATWVERHGLWLDLRSKAERGRRLASQRPQGEARLAQASTVRPGLTPDAALRRWFGEALAHALPNAADIAAGIGSAEQRHQLRVALRRLRSLLSLYADALPAADVAQWRAPLRALFGALGSARERDALQAAVLPALRAAGAPELELPTADPGEAAALLRSPAVNRLLLALLSHAAGPAPPDDAAPALADWALPVLARLHRRCARDARRYAELPDEQRHRLRRRLKRLRYGLEFAAPLLPAKRLARYLDALKRAQEALGAYQDLLVAERLYRGITAVDERAWFAVGWLVAREDAAARSAARAVARWAAAKPPFA